MKKHIFFDVGGVLLETKKAQEAALTYAAERAGYPAVEDASIFCGVPVPDAVIDAFGIGLSEAQSIISDYQEYFEKDALYECEPYGGAKELLASLAEKGAKLYAVSSMRHSSLCRLLEYQNMDQYFTEMRGASADHTISNKEDVLRFAMKKTGLITAKSGRLGAVKHDIVFVGDRWQDAMAARFLNVDFIAATYGYARENELPDKNCAVSVAELEEILIKMKKK